MSENKMETDTQQQPPGFSWLKTILISTFISILISGAAFHVYDTYYAPKFLTVDFKGYVEQQRKLFLTKQINEKDLQTNLKRFQERIQSVPENTIILIKEAVVSDEETLDN